MRYESCRLTGWTWGNNPPRSVLKGSLLLAMLFSLFLTTAQAGPLETSTETRRSETLAPVAITVKGQLTSAEDGQGLIGATVQVKGSTTGTITDIDGNYEIEVPSEESVLVFSYTGFQPQEMMVGRQTVIDVVMQLDVSVLNEVVVVGYGEQKKESLTGAVEQVKAEAFQSRAVTNPALALQGQTPGLVVTRTSSRPGNEALNLQIRGATSVNGGEPLVLIDGVPVIGLREFYDMNPDDIESVSVLKDGAASIYGSRAANGVIIVTTKRGAEGARPQVSYSNNFRLGTTGIRPPTPTMEEYAMLWLEAVEQDGTNDYWGWQSRENMERMAAGEEGIYSTAFWGDIYIGNADRFDDLFGYSYSQQHNISVSGSSANSRYRVSGQFADNTGALKTAYDGKKNYNIRVNYDVDVSDRLTIETGMAYQRGVLSQPSSGLDATTASYDPPFFPALNPYGEWYANFNIAGNRNSVAATSDGGRRDFVEDLTKVNLGLNYQILDGLDFRATGSFNKRDGRDDYYRLTVQPYTWNGVPSDERINPSTYYAIRGYNGTYQNYGAYLNYGMVFGGVHNFKATVGLTADKQEDRNVYAERAGLVDAGVYDLNVAPQDAVKTGGGHSDWGLYGYVARLNYSYNGKYLIELLGRRDGSSRFDEGFKWSNFGSFSLGWLLSEEAFIQDIRFISFLKLRGGYGEMGNQSGIGNYDYVAGVTNGTIPFGSTPALQSASRVSGITTNERTWERVSQANVAMDFSLFDHKVSGTVDFFRKTNDGMLANRIYPDVLGGTAPRTNIAVLETEGWEASLNYRNRAGRFEYNIGINMSDTRNEIVKLDGADSYNAGKVGIREGFPINSYFMYETAGLFADQAAVDAYYDQYGGGGEVPNQSDPRATLRAGDIIKVDLDGNGIIQGVSPDGGDLKYMGDASPHYVFGINLGAKFGGFDFTAFFQGVLDQNIQRTDWMSQPFFVLWSNQPTSYLGQTWLTDRADALYPRLTTQTGRARYNWQNNDFALQNNRYIRLKNVVLGYTLPQGVLSKLRLERARLYFSGNDLFEFTSIKDGFDPENGESSNTIYPFQRLWAVGLDVTF